MSKGSDPLLGKRDSRFLNLTVNVFLAHYPPSLESSRPELVFCPSHSPPEPAFNTETDEDPSFSDDDTFYEKGTRQNGPLMSLIDIESEECSDVESIISKDFVENFYKEMFGEAGGNSAIFGRLGSWTCSSQMRQLISAMVFVTF